MRQTLDYLIESNDQSCHIVWEDFYRRCVKCYINRRQFSLKLLRNDFESTELCEGRRSNRRHEGECVLLEKHWSNGGYRECFIFCCYLLRVSDTSRIEKHFLLPELLFRLSNGQRCYNAVTSENLQLSLFLLLVLREEYFEGQGRMTASDSWRRWRHSNASTERRD